MNEIDALAGFWAAAKEREDAARDERVEIENKILSLHPAKEEGSETFATPAGVKITLTGKVTYKSDLEKLTVLTAGWPDELRPVRIKATADESVLKAIRSQRPDLWKQIAPAIETKPAKTGVKITWSE